MVITTIVKSSSIPEFPNCINNCLNQINKDLLMLRRRSHRLKKKTEGTLLTKTRGGDTREERRGRKKDHTNLTRLQCRKQWSIVSLREQLAQTGDLIYPQRHKLSRTLTAFKAINRKRSFLQFSAKEPRTSLQCDFIEKEAGARPFQ